GLSLSGDQTERQLDQAADQHRNRDKQADLRVAQTEIRPDQRQRGALGPVGKLVNELNRQRDGNDCDAQESAVTARSAMKRRAQAA
ncbi:MAG TPA: hypothetical protein VJT16_18600, partial [Streptosporangiaceae bacterium]|nr:hypothetical protein [Streptosporangiaceae bacterium]